MWSKDSLLHLALFSLLNVQDFRQVQRVEQKIQTEVFEVCLFDMIWYDPDGVRSLQLFLWILHFNRCGVFSIFSCSEQELRCLQLWKPLLFSQPFWLSLAFVKRVDLMACAPSLAVAAIQNTVTEDIAGQKVIGWARVSGDFSRTPVYLVCPARATPSYAIRRR